MTSLNISLPESLKEFVEDQVERGGYSTPSEYVRELIRVDQKRRAEERLEEMLLQGLKGGKATPMTKRDWEALRKRVLEGREQRLRRRA
jgi:antitoxin ParD1/3/4